MAEPVEHDGTSGDPYVGLVDDAAHAAAVRARAERRERHDRAVELATWLGTLRDLAERAEPVALAIRGGRSLRGRLVGLGGDHVALALAGGGRVLVRLGAVRAARVEPGRHTPTAAGDRPAPGTSTVDDAIDELAASGGTVVLYVRDLVDPLRGEVQGIGEDVVTVRLDGPERLVAYLPAASIDAVQIS
ncbi:hypothetical protein [Egicoccus sp. AB-alg6-2]|uniref:hypothetical protein n=1 Tax=Egicoccus sp. AB-alg6-2 TaxID=3242692 RepID=UPI00359E658C